jgi:hypothetical protein
MLRPRRPQEAMRADRHRVWATRTFPSPRPGQRVATVESREAPQVAVEQGLVMAIFPSTIRRWGRQDRLKPRRSPAASNHQQVTGLYDRTASTASGRSDRQAPSA